MWRAFLDSLAESFAMTDPFAYSYYLAWKREVHTDAEVVPDPSPSPQVAAKASERPRGRGQEMMA